jgi:hypothetical protein
MLPWLRGKTAATTVATRPEVARKPRLLICRKCGGREFALLKVFGEIGVVADDQPIIFEPKRAKIACGHCLYTYVIPVDGAAPAVLPEPGIPSGPEGVATHEIAIAGHEEADKPESPVDAPMSLEEALEAMRKNPDMRQV